VARLVAPDVAFVSQARSDAADAEDKLLGSPELVIEVLARWNTKAEIREKAALYPSTGAQAFWLVTAKRETVSVAAFGLRPKTKPQPDL